MFPKPQFSDQADMSALIGQQNALIAAEMLQLSGFKTIQTLDQPTQTIAAQTQRIIAQESAREQLNRFYSFTVQTSAQTAERSSLAQFLCEEDHAFVRKLSARAARGVAVTTDNGQFALKKRGRLAAAFGYETIAGCNLLEPSLTPPTLQALDQIQQIPIAALTGGGSSFATYFVQQTTFQQLFMTNTTIFKQQLAKQLASECAAKVAQKRRLVPKTAKPEAVLIRQLLAQVEKTIEDAALSASSSRVTELSRDQQATVTDLMNHLSQPQQQISNLQLLQNDVLLPERRKFVIGECFDAYCKLCSLLPASQANPEHKLRYVLNEENLLSKAALIYTLLAIQFEEKQVVLNLPVGSAKLIQNLLIYQSAVRFTHQRETLSACVAVSQDNLAAIVAQLQQISQSCGLTMTTVDVSGVKKSYSNRRGTDLKHEMYQYDSQSDLIKFNFYGFQERRQDNVASFDRSVAVIVIAYEALQQNKSDVDRHVRRFCDENKIIRFDVAVSHSQDKQEQVLQVPASFHLITNSDLQADSLKTVVALFPQFSEVLQMDTKQQLTALRQQATHYIAAYTFQPSKHLIKQSLPQPKMELVQVIEPILQQKVLTDQIQQIAAELNLTEEENVQQSILQLQDKISINKAQNSMRDQNIAECLKQNAEEFCAEQIALYLQYCADKLNFCILGQQLKAQKNFSKALLFGDALQQNQIFESNLKQLNVQIKSPRREQEYNMTPYYDEEEVVFQTLFNFDRFHWYNANFDIDNCPSRLLELFMNEDFKEKVKSLDLGQHTMNQKTVYPKTRQSCGYSEFNKKLQLVIAANHAEFKKATEGVKQNKSVIEANYDRVILSYCQLLGFSVIHQALSHFEHRFQASTRQQCPIIDEIRLQLSANKQEILQYKFQQPFMFRINADVELLPGVSRADDSNSSFVSQAPATPTASIRRGTFKPRPVFRPVKPKQFSIDGIDIDIDPEIVANQPFYQSNFYQELYSQPETKKIFDIIDGAKPEEAKHQTSILIVTATDTKRHFLQHLAKQLQSPQRREIVCSYGVSQFRLQERAYSTIILLSQDSVIEQIKQVPSSCQQTIYQFAGSASQKQLPHSEEPQQKLIKICEFIGTEEMQVKLQKFSRGGQRVSGGSLLESLTQNIYKRDAHVPVLVKMLQNVYQSCYVVHDVRAPEPIIYHQAMLQAKDAVYRLAQATSLKLDAKFKFLIPLSQAELKPVQTAIKQKSVAVAYQAATSQAYLQKYQVFQQFRRKIDHISYAYDDTKAEDSALQLPLLIALNPLQRYLVPRCCVMNGYLQHILYTIQESSRVVLDSAKLKLNGTYTQDMQQINFFLVHLQLFREVFHGRVHPDLKQLVFLSHVFRKSNLSQRPAQQLSVFHQFIEGAGAVGDKQKAQLRIQLLKQLEIGQLYLQLKQTLGAKFKREIFKLVQPLYTKCQENTEASNKQQTEFVEAFMGQTRDFNGQFVYQKEDQLTSLITQVLQQFLKDYPRQQLEIFVADIKQRSCSPVWAVQIIIRRLKAEVLNQLAKREHDQARVKTNNCFVGNLMLSMRNQQSAAPLAGNNKGEGRRIIDWE